MPYRVDVWCPDCYGTDPLGCFDGGQDESEGRFATWEEAEAYGREKTKNGVWQFDVVRLDQDGVPVMADGRTG